MATIDLFPSVCEIARRQLDVISYPQLRHLGVNDQLLDSWKRSGMLARVERGVYLLAGAQLTFPARTMSLCLASGGIASHRTAAALHRLAGCRPGAPELTIERGQSFRRRGVRVHESTDLHLIAPMAMNGIPTTPVARTLVDLGAVAPARVEDATLGAVDCRLTTWSILLSTLVAHSRKGRRGCGPLRAVLDEHYGDPTDSHLERRFLRLILAAGLPRPVAQFDVKDDRGFIMRLDFAYPELMIAIEIDSIKHHATDTAFEADPIKRNRLRIAGWLLLEFTSRRLRHRPTAVCEEVAEAIRARQPNFRSFVTGL